VANLVACAILLPHLSSSSSAGASPPRLPGGTPKRGTPELGRRCAQGHGSKTIVMLAIQVGEMTGKGGGVKDGGEGVRGGLTRQVPSRLAPACWSLTGFAAQARGSADS
jgi:hypothetical protein